MAARPPAAEPFPALSHVPEAAQLIIRGDLPPDVPVIRITRAEYRGIAERVVPRAALRTPLPSRLTCPRFAQGLFISDGESRLGIIDESNPAFVEVGRLASPLLIARRRLYRP
jgi:hypothetical protein